MLKFNPAIRGDSDTVIIIIIFTLHWYNVISLLHAVHALCYSEAVQLKYRKTIAIICILGQERLQYVLTTPCPVACGDAADCP